MSNLKNNMFVVQFKELGLDNIKITRITNSRFDKSILNIYLEHGLFFTAYDEVAHLFKLKQNMDLDKDDMERLMEANSFRLCRYYAVVQAHKKRRTKMELKNKLVSMGFASDLSEQFSDMMESEGYIDDELFARDFIELKSLTMGKQKIRYELLKKGVDKHVINEKISEISNEDEESRAFDDAKRKIKSFGEMDRHKKREKLLAFLVRRGYSYECAYGVIKKLGDDIESDQL